MRAARLTVWLKMLVLLAPVLPLSAGEEPLQPTRAAEIQAHIERLQNNADINPQFRSRLLKILPKIAEGAPANVILPGCRGNTALHYACAISDIDLVSTLLRYGADTNIRTLRGARPTDCADGPNRSKIRSLLENTAQQTAATIHPVPEKTTANPKPTAEKKPLPKPPPPTIPSAQPEIEQVIEHLRNIPCAGATEYKHKEALLECLTCIKAGKPINHTPAGSGGNTALHHACAMGDFFMAIWLLEHGATPTRRNNSGQTPMDCLQGPNASFIRTHLREVL